MKKRRFITSIVALGLVLGVGGLLHAQIYNAAIAGKVTDQTGAVLPGVQITITAPVLLKPQTATTSAKGTYRFAELPVGRYTVTFALSNFQTVIRHDIILTAGFASAVNAQLGLAEVAETITVTGESPIVDTRQTAVSEAFDRDRLENIPTSRDPWVILEQTPGMVMDRENIGGNESGQQSLFVNRGTNFNQNVWNWDGVNISDQAAAGASPMYYSFDSFEEINIGTGGQDPSMQSAGTSINFIIKSGTNQLRAQASFYGIDSSFQGDNITEELREQDAGSGAPILYILDYSFDVGGPIIEDRLWAWGDYGKQSIHKAAVGFLKPGCDDPDDIACLNDDPTILTNWDIKVNAQLSDNNKFNFLFTHADKGRATRGASDTRPVETTWKQSGPTPLYKFEDTHIFNENFLVTGRFAYVGLGFVLGFQEPELRNVQATWDLAGTGVWGGSAPFQFGSDRPGYVANFDGNYFLTDAMGGDHEFKFGYQYKHTPIETFTSFAGDVWAVGLGGTPASGDNEAWLFRPAVIAYQGTWNAIHFQDTITSDRVTLKLGFRFDHQKGKNNPSSIPAHLIVPDILPATEFAGNDTFPTWTTFSPRIGFTYDLTGDGKSIVRASYGRYYDILDIYYWVANDNGAAVSSLYLAWRDLNGDGNVQRDELDENDVRGFDNFDPDDPTALGSPNRVDPNVSAPTTDEFIVGFEREVMPDFAVGVGYIYKRFGNLIWQDFFYQGGSRTHQGVSVPFVGVSASDFVPVTETLGDGQTVNYFDLPFQRPAGEIIKNRPDYHQRYSGFEITGNKRLSNNWMFNFAFSYATGREYFDGDGGVFDPTNVDIRDGGFTFYPSSGSGKSGLFMNSNWNFKLDGMYQFPYGIDFAGKLNARQGFPFLVADRVNRGASALSTLDILREPVGDSRLDNLWVIDLRLSKNFTFSPRGRISGFFDVFNLLNSNSVLIRERLQTRSTANRVQDILSARVFRLGVRFQF